MTVAKIAELFHQSVLRDGLSAQRADDALYRIPLMYDELRLMGFLRTKHASLKYQKAPLFATGGSLNCDKRLPAARCL